MARRSMVLNYPVLNSDPKLDLQNSTDEQRFVYVVKRVKNSVLYSPGQQLLRTEVVGLCDDVEWDITIDPVR